MIQQIGAQHETVVAVLRLRLANVQALRRLWARGDPRAVGAAASQMGDPCAVADFLDVRPGIAGNRAAAGGANAE